jgi:hypothetical protein
VAVAYDQLEAVRRLNAEWLAMPFPTSLRGVDIADTSVVMLDADVAGCVQTWLAAAGELDDERWNRLAQCLEDLDMVMPLLSAGAEAVYFDACRTIALMLWETQTRD